MCLAWHPVHEGMDGTHSPGPRPPPHHPRAQRETGVAGSHCIATHEETVSCVTPSAFNGPADARRVYLRGDYVCLGACIHCLAQLNVRLLQVHVRLAQVHVVLLQLSDGILHLGEECGNVVLYTKRVAQQNEFACSPL